MRDCPASIRPVPTALLQPSAVAICMIRVIARWKLPWQIEAWSYVALQACLDFNTARSVLKIKKGCCQPLLKMRNKNLFRTSIRPEQIRRYARPHRYAARSLPGDLPPVSTSPAACVSLTSELQNPGLLAHPRYPHW